MKKPVSNINKIVQELQVYIGKINKHKKLCLSKLLLKRYQAESADKNESKSEASTDTNESEENSS